MITLRAGTDVGNTALSVTVDIAKDEPPYAEENFYGVSIRRIFQVRKKLKDPANEKETTNSSQIFWEVDYAKEKQSAIRLSLPGRKYARH